MDELQRTEKPRQKKTAIHRPIGSRLEEEIETGEDLTRKSSAEEAYQRFSAQRDKEIARRRWGKIVFVIGAVTLLDWCAPVPVPLVGPPAIVVGLALMLIGGAVLYRGPRMKETNEAILIAMKYGNQLSVPRLAVEMDITLEQAEKIIDALVKKGIAEIDLDTKDPDSGIIYKVKGI